MMKRRTGTRSCLGQRHRRRPTWESLEPRHPLDSTAVINEIMYHPAEDQPTEWIEFFNQMTVDLDLSGWQISSGVQFEFPEGTILPGLGYLVVAAQPQAMQLPGVTVLGPWTGALANSGERIVLQDRNARVMSEVEYDDAGDWPSAADGVGATLMKADELHTATESPSSWRASVGRGGTPGAANQQDPLPQPMLQLHELAPGGDSQWMLEIAAREGAAVDSAAVQLVHADLPGGSVLRTITVSDAQPYVSVPRPWGDAIPKSGEIVALLSADGQQVLDAIRVGATPLARLDREGTAWGIPAVLTPGASNRFEIETGVVINEIMYHHRPIVGENYAEDDEEWIELYNRSDRDVDLSGWQLTDAVSYRFPAGTILAADGYLVVARDQAVLRGKHPDLTNVIGDFTGRLRNRDERVQLRDAVGNVADEVHYFSDGRWPATADGWGASLELTDPRADNMRGESWRASDEAARSEWHTYRYRGVAAKSMPGEPSVWNEFALGFLDGAGELLLDDVQVIQDPSGAAIPLIQNGSFDDGTAAHWRLLGNHQRSTVVNDQGNYVLHLVADGATEYQGNQIETTFVGNARIDTNAEYEISFRARWLAGSQQVNSRLYFNRLPRTTVLTVPTTSGTPGRRNSRWTPNIGPTFDQLQVEPVLPTPQDPIQISVRAADPDGVAQATLWYSSDGATWSSLPLLANDDGLLAATLPAHPQNTVLQFYVRASDGLGAASDFPARGPDSRALIQVLPNAAPDSLANQLRLIMTAADDALLHRPTNSLSNQRLGATVVYRDQMFFDVGARLKGSFVGRNAARVGFNIEIPSDQRFRGVHTKISVDRSTHAVLGIDEILLKHAANHAGGIPSMYDDLIQFTDASGAYAGDAMLRMAGFDAIYLDSQFPDGSDGTVYEYEVIRWPTTTVDGNPESLKRAGGLDDPNGYANIEFRDVGDNKEAYRWVNLIVSNRTRDDYAAIIALNRALGQANAELDAATQAVMDVDQWLRTAAFQSLFGPGDAYYTGGNVHNFRLYARPDGKVMYMPWDWDSAFQLPTNSGLIGSGRLSRVVRLPHNLRDYYGHMVDIIETTFNEQYMRPWAEHYTAVSGQSLAGRLSYIQQRSEFAVARIERDFPRRPFALNSTDPLTTTAATITVQGSGWVDVAEVRLDDDPAPLTVAWSAATGSVADQWSIQLPLELGVRSYVLTAVNRQGEPVGQVTVQVERLPPRGDFSQNGVVDARDIDLLFAQLRLAQPNLLFDLNGDGQVESDDTDVLLGEILGTGPGDANLDRRFDSQDLVSIFQRGRYEDGVPFNAGWEDSDWDGDGDFTTRDLVVAFQRGSYQTG